VEPSLSIFRKHRQEKFVIEVSKYGQKKEPRNVGVSHHILIDTLQKRNKMLFAAYSGGTNNLNGEDFNIVLAGDFTSISINQRSHFLRLTSNTKRTQIRLED